MRASAVRPTGAERFFRENELIVSKTNPKGIITYANDVFCRMAAATEDELLGQPHSVIRHPEMPRAVFKLLWDTLGAGSEIFAYVNNLGFDGAHYWVFAHVTPSRSMTGQLVGYHSNRRAPAKEAVAAVEPLYRKLLQIERDHPSSKDGLAASVAALQTTLSEAGMTYDEFVWSVTP
ncbi:MAG: PAS domain-containing protein [Kineosporiaceae bacterium]